MIHYSCDCCKRSIDPQDELRYVVRMEAFVAMDPTGDDDEADRDHLEEVQDILQRLEEEDCEQMSRDVYREMRYDLCSACHKRFVADPLGRQMAMHFDFSEN